MTAAGTLYIPGDTILHRLHPATKLVLSFFCLVAGLALPFAWGGYAAFVLLVFPLAQIGGVARPLLKGSLTAVLPFAISLLIVQGLFWPGGTPVIGLGPLALKAEGLRFAIRSVGRILIIVGSFLLLSRTTRPDALMLALNGRGVPHSITYIILSTLQIIPRFQAKARTIVDAQRSRGLETEGGVRRRASALLPLVQPLILGSLLDIEERAIALEARAFGRRGPKTSLMRLPDSPRQRLVRRLLLLLSAAFILGRLAWLLQGS